MTEKYLGRRLISFVPIALAAILLVIIGPERLQHLQAKERWGILGCLLLACTWAQNPLRLPLTCLTSLACPLASLGEAGEQVLPAVLSSMSQRHMEFPSSASS